MSLPEKRVIRSEGSINLSVIRKIGSPHTTTGQTLTKRTTSVMQIYRTPRRRSQHKKVQAKAFFLIFITNTQYAHFRGNPLYQATKRHLKTDKRSKMKKNESKRLILFWFSFHSLFGAWKIVGMTIKKKKRERTKK